MSPLFEKIAFWLADIHLLAGALLAVALPTALLLRQPAQRMAVAKSTLAALGVLAVLCALPGWSLVHLMAADVAADPGRAPIAVTPPMPPQSVNQLIPQVNIDQVPVQAAPSIIATAQPQPSEPGDAEPAWPTALVVVQAVGSAVVVAWLAAGAIAARRLRRQAEPAPPELATLLAELAGSAHPPALLVSSTISTPVALGVRRPVILVPAALLQPPALPGGSATQVVAAGSSALNDQRGATPGQSPGLKGGSATQIVAAESNAPNDQRGATPGQSPGLRAPGPLSLRAILAHELAHIAAGDLRTLAVTRLLLVLFWPQPLFWLLRRRVRFDQELLADAAAADVAGRLDYAEQLVGWAREAGPRGRAPRLAGAVGLWEGPSQLKRRIALLLDERLTILRQASRRWRVGTACAALFAATLLSLVTLQRQEVAAQAVSELSVPQQAREVNGDDASVLAAESNVIQGRAVDERGNPLSGVEVTLYRHSEWDTDSYELLDVQNTDSDGAFHFASVVDLKEEPSPNGLQNAMFLEPPVHHLSILGRAPGRASAHSSVLLLVVVKRGESMTLSMPPAVALRGRVTDSSGSPVVGARVAVTSAGASNRGPVGEAFAATTDQDGRYLIENLAAFEAGDSRGPRQADAAPQGPLGTYRLLVEHPGYAITSQDIASIPSDLDVQLQPGAVIEGTVTLRDQNGNVTPAAAVTVLTRRNTNTAADMLAAMNANPVRTTKTDAVGRYRIESLSAGNYNVSAISNNWVTHGIESIEARPDVVTRVPGIVLTRGGVAHLQLVDAKTGEPLSLPRGSRGYVSPMRREPRTVTDFSQPIVQFSVDGVGDIPLPGGDYRFSVLVPESTPKAPQWMSVGYMAVPGPSRPITIDYRAIVEGETTNITILMEQKSATLGEVDDASSDVEQRTPAIPKLDFVPAATPADNQGSSTGGILDGLDPTRGGDAPDGRGLSFDEAPADAKSDEASAAASEEAAETVAAPVHELRVRVTDVDGKPLSGAKVRQNHVHTSPDAPANDEKFFRIKNHDYVADRAGVAVVSWRGNSVDLRLWVSHPGYVPLYAMWAKHFQSDGDQIPAQFTFAMKRGTTIGGVVRDELGRPIQGATVNVRNAWAFEPAGAGTTPGLRPVESPWLASVVTDAAGRWTADTVPDDDDLEPPAYFRQVEPLELDPPDLGSPIHFDVTHREFVSFASERLGAARAPTINELRAATAEVRLVAKPSDAAASNESAETALPASDFVPSATPADNQGSSTGGILDTLDPAVSSGNQAELVPADKWGYGVDGTKKAPRMEP